MLFRSRKKKGRRKVSKKIKPKKKDFSIFKEIENKFYRNKYLVKLYERIYLKSQIVLIFYDIIMMEG